MDTILQKNQYYYPQNYPMNFSGKLSVKIVQKKDYLRADGTKALYAQVFLNQERIKIPLHISVAEKHFDIKKQRVKKTGVFAADFNLIIEKILADINGIEVFYRLSNLPLDVSTLLKEYQNPSSRLDFIKFWEEEMENQKLILRKSTYDQQISILRKIKGYKDVIFFNQINIDFVNKMIYYFSTEKKNSVNTIATLTKSFKKYLHIANKKGIVTPLSFQDVPRKRMQTRVTYLDEAEINLLFHYYESPFIKESHKVVLAKFLFSCFTGMRIGDILNLTEDTVMNDVLFFTAKKTNKTQRMSLNKTAQKLVSERFLFNGTYTPQTINKLLKEVVLHLGIKKKVTFHISRHSFATNFLINGGRVEVLQKLLGHSEIKETMVYVHVVDDIINDQIFLMDKTIKPAE